MPLEAPRAPKVESWGVQGFYGAVYGQHVFSGRVTCRTGSRET